MSMADTTPVGTATSAMRPAWDEQSLRMRLGFRNFIDPPRTPAAVPTSLLLRKLLRGVTRRYRARSFRVNTFSRCRFDAVVLGTLLLFDRRRLVVIGAWESFLVTAWTWILRR